MAPEVPIMIVGDVCIDWFEMQSPPEVPRSSLTTPAYNWQTHPQARMFPLPGGAMLVGHFVEAATGESPATYELPNIENIPPQNVVHSLVQLGRYAVKGKEDRVRVSRYKGFCGSAQAALSSPPQQIKRAKVLIVDDAGNGFRNVRDVWPEILVQGAFDFCVLKVSRPIAQGPLWEHLLGSWPQKTVVVLEAEDLRRSGMAISRGLSWERTAMDFATELATKDAMKAVRKCPQVVVRLAEDGAIYWNKEEDVDPSTLVFDTQGIEGGYGSSIEGNMPGLGSMFTAALCRHVLDNGFSKLEEGITAGMRASRNLLELGFLLDGDGYRYPVPETFEAFPDSTGIFRGVRIPKPDPDNGPGDWSIITALSGGSRGIPLESLAASIVLDGPAKTLKAVPVATFGNFTAIDRREIETFRSIQKIIREYRDDPNAKRPLSIAVFGPPGSGKSFGIKEIAKSLEFKDDAICEFNLSQFQSYEDLVASFHVIRNINLKGKLPLVFFDEFDSSFGDEELGWLKYFLAPMQDGGFYDGAFHPLGRGVFVFAGGTHKTYEAFRARESEKLFKSAKGPDFLSRLRGFVDILGPNPKQAANQGEQRPDTFFAVRRAMFLHSLLARKRPDLVEKDKALVNRVLLSAFLNIPEYRHGVRSMEAIIDTSTLGGAAFYQPYTLPPASLLDMHVDGKHFLDIVQEEAPFHAVVERIAKNVHDAFREQQKDVKPPDDPAMRDWEDLDEIYKNSNRQQAASIPEKLRAIGYTFEPKTDAPCPKVEFTEEQIDLMAQMEHERFVRERIAAGFKAGERSLEKKTTPYLGGWDTLSDEVKSWDQNAVRKIPELLEAVGFCVRPL